MNTKRTKNDFEEVFFKSCSEVFIHPTSYIGPHVQLGTNVKIGPFCTIIGNITIDDDTRLYGHAIIGMPAEDRSVTIPQGTISIGKQCHIREFVSINGSKYSDGQTTIGDNCYIMNFCYVSHDAILEHDVTLINGVNLGGHTYLEHHVTMMANSATHQFCRLGAHAALSAFSATSQDIPPFSLMNGIRASFYNINRVSLVRNNFSKEDINCIKKITKLFFQEKKTVEAIKAECTTLNLYDNKYVQQFIKFVETSKRGITRQTVIDKNN